MLAKSTRKKLLEQSWEKIASKDLNPYQTLRRFRDKANLAINDLTLIAQRLPEEAQKDIFNYTNIKKLASAMLRENEPMVDNSTTIDVRRIELAALLVRIGIMICIQQYQTKIEQDSDLNDLTISHLLRARDICTAISFKMRLPQVKEEAEKEDLVYLFNWNRIKEVHESKVSELNGEDTQKFVRLIGDIYYHEYVYSIPDVINSLSFDQSQDDANSNILFEFTDFYGGQCHGGISLNFEKKTAHLSMHTEDKRILQHEFVIKIENENLYVYKKRKIASKLASRSKKDSA